MDNVDKFINNNFTDNYGGGGCCINHEWFADDSGTGHGADCSADCSLGRGRGDSNGWWDSKGFGEGNRSGGYVSSKTNEVAGRCYVNRENLYGQHR